MEDGLILLRHVSAVTGIALE